MKTLKTNIMIFMCLSVFPFLKAQEKEKSEAALGYTEEEVSFKNGENVFSATLTIPKGEGPFPALVFISGSGPQDRDETILGFKPFKILAEAYARKGIAVLRYDDRGTGKTSGKSIQESTTSEFAGDVKKAVAYLRTRAEIKAKQIGLLGHSEGGLVAPMVAAQDPDIELLVLLAGPGVKGREVLTEQAELIGRASKLEASQIEKQKEQQKRIIEAIDEGDSARIAEIIRESLPEHLNEAYKQKVLKSQTRELTGKWFRFFINYDPIPALEKVNCPVFLLFGELDLQVPPHQSKAPMLQALRKAGNEQVRVEVFPKANHLFQAATLGTPQEYAFLKREFAPGFVEMVLDWTSKIFRSAK